jgi:Tfp pilus assembly pilus retraction ATPase PilT
MAPSTQFLNQVLERDGSDLHFIAGDPPRVRQYGELKALRPEPLAAEMVKMTLYEIMPKLSVERFEAKDGTDFAYSIPGWPLPRQRHAPAERHGRGVSRHPLQGANRG